MDVALTLSIANLVLIVVSVFFIKSYIPSYLSEKGRNPASKEDVSIITEKIESIKAQYSID